MKRIICLLLPLLILCGCSGPVKVTDFALDTIVSVTIYQGGDEKTAEEAIALCRTYEDIFSRTDPDSELYRLNHREIAQISDELAFVLGKALEFAALSGGAFDPTIGTVSSLWNFAAENPEVPEKEAIHEGLSHVDYAGVTLSGNTVTFHDPDTEIDLGAIAKGYIADQLCAFLKAEGVTSAIIDLGGNLYCLGSKERGKPFEIAVQQPFGSSSAVSFRVQDLSVVTSGIYQRCFELDGRLYHHIISPQSGYPAETGLLSVTILAPTSLEADALSTTCFLLGAEAGAALVDEMDGIGAVFITEDGSILYSENYNWDILMGGA